MRSRAADLLQPLLRCSSPTLRADAPFQLGILSRLQPEGPLRPPLGRSYAAQASAASEEGSPAGGSEPAAFPAAAAEQGFWARGSRRSGVIAVKAGMTQAWDEWGVRQPLTVLWVDECEVVQVKEPDRNGLCGLQLGCGSKREKQLDSTLAGHFRAAGVPLKRHVREFRVSPDCLLPVGARLGAAHFAPGQFIDVQGTTKGKGFQGVMKRWGFAGQGASHGNSLAHRAPGGIGGCQDPGKVWPGKKMPGRMGGKLRTVACVRVQQVDPQRNLLYVRGQVPGHRGNFLYLQDARLKAAGEQPPRPIPTLLGPLPQGLLVAPREEPPHQLRA